jgi:hypothetical protein
MRSTIGRQLNRKAERWYHGEGRRPRAQHGATASPKFLAGDLTGAGDPPHGTPLLSSAVRPGRIPHCPVRLATPRGDPLRTSRFSGSYRAQQHNPFSARQVDRDHFDLRGGAQERERCAGSCRSLVYERTAGVDPNSTFTTSPVGDRFGQKAAIRRRLPQDYEKGQLTSNVLDLIVNFTRN